MDNKRLEGEKISTIIMETIMEGFEKDENYHHFNEAIKKAMEKAYFPDKNVYEILEILRNYAIWNEFERTCQKKRKNEK